MTDTITGPTAPPPLPEPDPAVEGLQGMARKLDPELEKVARNVFLNGKVSELDAIVRDMPPATQMGVLMLVQAKCFSRLMNVMGKKNNGEKHPYLKAALKDFELKIREFGYRPPGEMTKGPTSQVRQTESK